jgi:hypothetical protein
MALISEPGQHRQQTNNIAQTMATLDSQRLPPANRSFNCRGSHLHWTHTTLQQTNHQALSLYGDNSAKSPHESKEVINFPGSLASGAVLQSSDILACQHW